MDIEKLIEQLRKSADFEDYPIVASFAAIIEKKYLRDAATALSTLQANLEEMTQRNDENLGMCRIWERRYSELQAENEKLRAEVESLKKEHCAGCSVPVVEAERLRDLNEAPNLRAELEQVKRDFGGICEYIDREGFLRKQFCENGNPDLEPCICPSLQEHPGYIDSDDCEGCDHFCNSWCGQKED